MYELIGLCDSDGEKWLESGCLVRFMLCAPLSFVALPTRLITLPPASVVYSCMYAISSVFHGLFSFFSSDGFCVRVSEV